MINNSANVALTQQQVSDAMRGIREAISSNNIPNTDVLELTEKVEAPEDRATACSNKKTEAPQEDTFINILDKALSTDDNLINPHTISESNDAMRQFIDAAHKKSAVEGSNHSALESLVIAALKPHLSAWLNTHLPRIVQTVVEKEIKKLVP